jgi:V/A-type H+-transporting ATPase subunit I
MIVPMKKVTIFASTKNIPQVVDGLKDFGLLHPTIGTVESQELDELQEHIAEINRSLVFIPENKKAKKLKAKSITKEEATSISDSINEIGDKLRQLSDKKDALVRELSRYERFGSVDPSTIKDLEERGYTLSLISYNKDQVTLIPEDTEVIVLSKGKQYIALAIANPDELDDQITVIPWPTKSTVALQDELDKLIVEIEELSSQLDSKQQERKDLALYLQTIEADVMQAQVSATLSTGERVSYVQGFAPRKEMEQLEEYAKTEGWGTVIEEPGPEDNVPVQIKRNKLTSLIKPVFDIMDTYPGYKEHDISLWFLMFFTVFFGMIIGDAGYGAFLLLISIILLITGKRNVGIALLTVLSTATVVWGGITGNWFGLESLSNVPFFRQFIIPELDAYKTESGDVVKWLCFSLALVHLVLAHVLAFIKQIREKPHIHAFAQLGWIAFLVGVYFFVLNIVISPEKYPLPDFMLPVILSGIGVVFVFAKQDGGNFFKGILESLKNVIQLVLDAIGGFSDIVSYIRLFAVGLAGIEIANSFNAMAMGMMGSMEDAGAIAGGIFVVFIGHTINLLMALLSVVVHGVRLKMLEFSGHIGNEWSGFAYKPLGQKQ